VAVVTHDLAAAERHAATVAIVDGGRLVACGSPRELRAAAGGAGVGGPKPDRIVVDLVEAFRRLTGRDESDLLPRTRGER
jgi:ABC-type multidrug transport system ATPase subunit